MTDTGAARSRLIAVLRRCGLGELLFRRWGATVLDILVVAAGSVAMGLVVPGNASDAVLTVLGWVIILSAVGYYVICEGLWGRTVGKLAAGLIIVDQMGRPPGIGRAILRTLLRLIEVNPFLIGGLPAAIVVACNEKRQRLGDMAAGTYVIPFKDLASARDPDIGVF